MMFQNLKEVSGFFHDLRTFRDTLWSSLKETFPLYRKIGPEKWHEFLPTQSVKEVLINRRYSFVIDPENEVIAGIFVAVWILYENYYKYTVADDFEKMERIGELLRQVQEQTRRMLNGTKTGTVGSRKRSTGLKKLLKGSPQRLLSKAAFLCP